MRATVVCAKRGGGAHTDRQTDGQTDRRPAAGRPLSRVLQPAAPAALRVAGFSYFLPIRDTSGYKP